MPLSEGDATHLLIELVSRYSPSKQEGEAVRYLVDWMTGHGFTAEIDPVGNAYGFRGRVDAPRSLLLLGHIDTVTGEIPVRVEDGKLYGRGSVDAKGSLCTFAAAAAGAIIPSDWRVVVVGAVEEEIATSQGAHHIRDQFHPDLCIIGEPSGAERITLGYKGRLILEYAHSRPMTHSALPEPSAGAIGAAFWQNTLTWSAEQNVGFDRLFDQITPHLHTINTESDGFTETVNLQVGFRLPPRLTPQAVLDAVQSFTLPESQLTLLGAEYAYQGDKNNPLVRGLLAAIRGQGGKPGFVLKSGTSDMNVVGAVWDCPMVAYGPGDSHLDHTPQEHLPLAEYHQAVAILRAFIENLDSG
jgi:LysW-gamma-L-lysine carboxypeptidase